MCRVRADGVQGERACQGCGGCALWIILKPGPPPHRKTARLLETKRVPPAERAVAPYNLKDLKVGAESRGSCKRPSLTKPGSGQVDGAGPFEMEYYDGSGLADLYQRGSKGLRESTD